MQHMKLMQTALPLVKHGHQLPRHQQRFHQHQRALGIAHTSARQLQHCAVVVGPHLALHQNVGLFPLMDKVPLLPGRIMPLQQAVATAQLIGSGRTPLPRHQCGARHHHILEPPQRQGHQIVRHLAHGAQGDVVFSLTHVDHLVGEIEFHLHSRAERGKAGQQFAHHAVAGTDRAGKAQATAILFGQRLNILLRLPSQREDLPRLLVEGLARLGQTEAAGGALQQLRIE